MSIETLEKELRELKERVARLEDKARPVAKPTWRDVIGSMPNDEVSREAARLGAEWRAQENLRE